MIQGRKYVAPEKPVKRSPREQELYVPEDLAEAARWALPPKDQQPRVVLRFAAEKELLLSGMITGGNEIAEKPAVVDVPHGKGHVVLFANNPMWRNETMGSFFLVFNAIMNYDHLDAGRTARRKTRHRLQSRVVTRKNKTDWNRCSIAVWSAASLLNGIAGLPAPALFLGFPPHGGIHYLRLQRFDNEDWRLFLAEEHTPDFKRVKRYIDQHEFVFGCGGMPAFFATAKNHQQVMVMFRIDTK